MTNIIGRKKEIETIKKLYHSKLPQFLAVYGRRRVGKTFLIDEALKGNITFRHSGLSPIDTISHKNNLREQLKHFYLSLQMQGMKKSKCPSSWLEAFFMLEMYLQSIDDGSRQVVFLDELPWMDTPRSGFVTALEALWNNWGCHRDNFMLVVCGSATSWITDNLINNHGGLYGRITCQLKLSPFTLNECEQFFHNKGVRMSHYDIVQSYMIFGGIPYYLSYFESGLSLAQNVDNLFFRKNAVLKDEFDRLFASVFSRPDEMKRIVLVLGERRAGYTQEELAKAIGLTWGGTFSTMLKALAASDFIEAYIPFGKSKREKRYKLIDHFCLFYMKFVRGYNSLDPNFWMHNVTSQVVSSWRGFAFEEVCFSHIDQIKKALDILGVASTQSAWAIKGDDDTEGTQIDLLINRKDGILNMCEMKFYSEKYTISKSYHTKLVHRQNVLTEKIPRKSFVHNVLVTTEGLNYNEYSNIFQNVVVIDDLFCD